MKFCLWILRVFSLMSRINESHIICGLQRQKNINSQHFLTAFSHKAVLGEQETFWHEDDSMIRSCKQRAVSDTMLDFNQEGRMR